MKRTTAEFVCLILVLGLAGGPAVAEDETPPTPEERIAALHAESAGARADLGMWAATKHLGIEARAWLHAAILLDPDCRRARVKLGHRKDGDGGWNEDREHEIRDDTKAREKYKSDFAEREAELLAEEAAAYADLGLALRDEHRPDLAEPLLLHAFFLDPDSDRALAGLGLTRIDHTFGTEELAKEVAGFAGVRDVGARFLGGVTGETTAVRACGAVTAEVPGDAKAAAELARIGQRSLLLTARRFTDVVLPQDWVWLAMAKGYEQFTDFVNHMDLTEERRAFFLAIGGARVFSPRHCVAGWFQPGTDAAASGAPYLLHMAAENLVWTLAQQNLPIWFSEAVGIEAYYAVSGRAGLACVTFEESQGIVSKEDFQDTAAWPALLLRRAAVGDLPRMEFLSTAKLTGLSAEDVIAAHSYYRFLLLTRPKGPGAYTSALCEGKKEPEAFEAAFGAKYGEISDELIGMILGR